MRPWLLRPACVGSDSTRLFSGLSVVISSKLEIDMNRRPGLVGLNFLTGIYLDPTKQPFDLLALTEPDDRLLPVRRAALGRAAAQIAAALAAHVDRVHLADLDALPLVLLLQRLLDLGLGGRARDAERVPALHVELVGPLGDDRPDHDLGRLRRR